MFCFHCPPSFHPSSRSLTLDYPCSTHPPYPGYGLHADLQDEAFARRKQRRNRTTFTLQQVGIYTVSFFGRRQKVPLARMSERIKFLLLTEIVNLLCGCLNLCWGRWSTVNIKSRSEICRDFSVKGSSPATSAQAYRRA
ncbi:dorsal root ganglia homeobox protein [Plakobranchus ocellatus]|uniref:Dorsal root ganglia homeobox protein n=1 Tax=Plakobranchus ocellatus TaxID=259542 RepID=A0AAV4D1R5_9GAST|nr:dorsal root ganglia homeobox protein [Plakobranchus ocellatus]